MGKGDVYKDIVTTINDFLRDSAVLTSWVTSWKSYSPGPGGHLPAPAAPQLLLLRAPGRGSELRPCRRRKWGHVSINHGLASRPCPVCRKVVIRESHSAHQVSDAIRAKRHLWRFSPTGLLVPQTRGPECGPSESEENVGSDCIHSPFDLLS